MATGPGGNRNQPVGPFFNSLFSKAIVDNVVQNHAITAVCGLINFDPRAQRSDPYRHLPLGANLDIVLQALVAAVHDLVDSKGCRRSVWVGLIVAVKLFSDPLEPDFEHIRLAVFLSGVQCRKGADHASFALGDDQIRRGDDK